MHNRNSDVVLRTGRYFENTVSKGVVVVHIRVNGLWLFCGTSCEQIQQSKAQSHSFVAPTAPYFFARDCFDGWQRWERPTATVTASTSINIHDLMPPVIPSLIAFQLLASCRAKYAEIRIGVRSYKVEANKKQHKCSMLMQCYDGRLSTPIIRSSGWWTFISFHGHRKNGLRRWLSKDRIYVRTYARTYVQMRAIALAVQCCRLQLECVEHEEGRQNMNTPFSLTPLSGISGRPPTHRRRSREIAARLLRQDF